MDNPDHPHEDDRHAASEGVSIGMAEDKTALVGDVDRTGVTFALTDADGSFIEDSVRSYEAEKHTTISGALLAFKEDSGLAALPRRCALAVAGVPRGDTISITNSRWFISKSGLGAILQRPPLIINDFAANVWAVSATESRNIQAAGAAAPSPGPGTFVVVGMGKGLGVAAFLRDEAGGVTVLPTEAGHSDLADDSADVSPLFEIMKKEKRLRSAETLLSSPGLAALRNAMAEQQGSSARVATGDEVVRSAALGDPQARTALLLFSKVLWRFAGNLTLMYGAWDGVFMTGRMVNSLRSTLRQPDTRQNFIIPGPYANMLRNVPAGFLLLDRSALRGAAEAIRQLG